MRGGPREPRAASAPRRAHLCGPLLHLSAHGADGIRAHADGLRQIGDRVRVGTWQSRACLPPTCQRACVDSHGGGMRAHAQAGPRVNVRAHKQTRMRLAHISRRLTSIICSSVRKSQKPSIMSTASLVPAIIRSRRLAAICRRTRFEMARVYELRGVAGNVGSAGQCLRPPCYAAAHGQRWAGPAARGSGQGAPRAASARTERSACCLQRKHAVQSVLE